MKNHLAWLIGLLAAVALTCRYAPRPARHVLFVVRDECFVVTVDGRYSPAYLMIEGLGPRQGYLVHELSSEQYLALLEQVEADGLWHRCPPNCDCAAEAWVGRGAEVETCDQQRLVARFFAHPVVRNAVRRLHP